MPDFKETRDQLRQARDEKEQARSTLFQARERLKRLRAREAELNRSFDPDNQQHVIEQQQLKESLAQAEAALQQSADQYEQSKAFELGSFKDFVELGFTDPRQNIEKCSDEFPFLLLPVRIETRFKSVMEDNQTKEQLWLRVYPDECGVDSFEAELSETEVESGRSYWAEIWRAGGDEGGERAAWRALVASHGEGRAAWIVENYLPTNPDQQIKKASPDDVILVISTDKPLAGVEATALPTFWASVWLADGDKSKEEEARNTLVTALAGDEARAAELIKDYEPFNLKDAPAEPLKKTDVVLKVATIVFPQPEAAPTKTESWSQAARVNVLPDRFVIMGISGGLVAFEILGRPIPQPLIAGPDPSAKPQDQLHQEDGEMVVPDELRWMVDFERAIEVGMGFKIDLSPAQARAGFDSILALGIRLSADEKAGQSMLEELFQHHSYSRNGLSLLPQGTPTNNTEQSGSGFTRSAEADSSFDVRFKAGDPLVAPQEWASKRDGQWLAEYLGIEAGVLKKARHFAGTDQREARAMNVALWPATLGYMMETMMEPVFDDDVIEQTRWFFNNFVSGRGAIPAIRIGNQPYGILPTTAFSRMKWPGSTRLTPIPGLPHPPNHTGFLLRLQMLLAKMDEDWTKLSKDVSFVGKPKSAQKDAHQILLDIVGLHSGSVEYYQRYAESLAHLFNLFNLSGLGGAFIAALIAAGYVQSGMGLLQKLGYDGETAPDILNKYFLTAQNLLKGPVVDDRPLSEAERIRKYTDEADETKRRNYIEWLIDAARTSLETIRQEKGFKDNKAPNALLYLMLRHSLVLGYWDTSLRLHRAAEIELPLAVRREPSFIHVHQGAPGAGASSESRWSYLYKAEPRITDTPAQLVADFIPKIIFHSPQARYLSEQILALEALKDAPTARLERVFAEHVDCCSYRLDAWRLGLLHYQLAAMRFRRQDNEVVAAKGLYLGCYGWLEHVRPEHKELTPVELDPELDLIFNKDGEPPVTRDKSNMGYIHAPSLNHAVTAAVLRNGYEANATPSNPQSLSVNLSSERVRRALSILEGIRGGQSLGALLGYQFERGLHDRHNQAEVDQFIYRMRKAFPLRANRILPTKKDEDEVSIEAIEARNVMDGVSLVEHIKKTGHATFPFGIAKLNQPKGPDPGQLKAINSEVDRLLDTHDAVADLAIAEGVHQAVQGNYDRVASTLETYSKGNFPPEPDVVRTPRSGTALTHRVGLQLEVGLPSTGTLRAQTEPALNKWLGQFLPPLADVFCQVVYYDPVAKAQASHDLSLDVLQLQPIDLIYLLRTESQQAMSELDDRVLRRVRDINAPRPDAQLKIKYMGKPVNKISMFELAPLVSALRSIVLRSRPLRASDVALQTESEQKKDEDVFVDKARLSVHLPALGTLHTDLNNFNATPANIDVAISSITALLSTASGFGVPQTGWGFAHDWKHLAFTDTLKKVDELVDRWEATLADYDAQITDYNNLPAGTTTEQKFAHLHKAERLISTSTTLTPPANPDDFRDALDVNKRTPFETRLNGFKAVLASNTTSLTMLIGGVNALLPVSDFDLDGIKIAEIEERVAFFAGELNARAKAVAAEVNLRLKKVQSLIDAHDLSASARERVEFLTEAAQALFGEDFRLIPEFGLSDAQADEWEKAVNASQGGELLKYQTQDLEVEFPVDDWLHGAARVREKLKDWEQAAMLAVGFGRAAEPELLPIQLPYKANDSWLGLEFPLKYELQGDRLLYTAHYATAFQKTQRQCGLLLDEWTEVIPGKEETTGITFHYDRPNSEPPQAMLLVTPPAFDGAWGWQDLVDALRETLEMARKRAVEPVQVDATPYARFLPATVMAVMLYQISIAANLAVNNSFLAAIPGGDND